MDKITHNVRSAQWLQIITSCQQRPEGISVKQWLSENGIKDKAYYYWLRKFRRQAYAEMQTSSDTLESNEVAFAEVSNLIGNKSEETSHSIGLSDEATETIRPVAVIKNAEMTIALTNDISESLLSRILREVSHA